MKHKYIRIPVPAEAPEAPEGWTFTGYSVVDAGGSCAWPSRRLDNGKSLDEAGRFYAHQGVDEYNLIACYERQHPDGSWWQIYCLFQMSPAGSPPGGDLYVWGPWINQSNGLPFDFSALEELVPVVA